MFSYSKVLIKIAMNLKRLYSIYLTSTYFYSVSHVFQSCILFLKWRKTGTGIKMNHGIIIKPLRCVNSRLMYSNSNVLEIIHDCTCSTVWLRCVWTKKKCSFMNWSSSSSACESVIVRNWRKGHWRGDSMMWTYFVCY